MKFFFCSLFFHPDGICAMGNYFRVREPKKYRERDTTAEKTHTSKKIFFTQYFFNAHLQCSLFTILFFFLVYFSLRFSFLSKPIVNIGISKFGLTRLYHLPYFTHGGRFITFLTEILLISHTHTNECFNSEKKLYIRAQIDRCAYYNNRNKKKQIRNIRKRLNNMKI